MTDKVIIRSVKPLARAAAAALLLLLFRAGSISAGEKFKYEPFVPTDPIMPLSAVKPGMKGECLTVVKGSDIVSFRAEVVDIVDSPGVPRNLILIKVSGKVVEAAGGIASGMSGSPFYINGRLVGAIGYGWNFTDHFQGLVTPIEEMLEIWNNPEIIPSFDPAPVVAETPPQRKQELPAPKSRRAVSEDAAPEDTEIPPGSGKPEDDGAEREDGPWHDVLIEEIPPDSQDLFVLRDMPAPSDDINVSWDLLVSRDKAISRDRAVSPDMGISSRRPEQNIFVSGISKKMAARITEALGAEAAPFGGSSGGAPKEIKYNPKIRPGMAIGASLLWGDAEVSSIGTLTAVSKDGRFIAYAHPFMGFGPTSAALMDAHISSVVPSVNNSFKLGSTRDIIGIVTQDRPQGIGGRIGRFAPAASVSISLTDVDSGRSYRKSFQMVQDKYLLSVLASPAIVGITEDLWGRSGGGSAKVTATYSGSSLRGGWKRTNIFVSDTDVTKQMLAEFDLLTQFFAVNPFQEIRPFGVDVEVEVTQQPRVIYIEDVKVPKGPFKPGDTISFDITLRPWRKDPFSRTYTLTAPKNASGIAQLLVRGGGIAEETAEYQDQAWRSISSMPILLRELDAKETNDQIVMEIRGQEALETQISRSRKGDPDDLMNDKLKSEIIGEKKQEGSLRIVRTNYYVDGIIHKLIKIDGAADPEEDADIYDETEDADAADSNPEPLN